jgi:hypothetical protein
MLLEECLPVCLAEWAEWAAWVAWECNTSQLIKFKRPSFDGLFFTYK